MNEPWKFVLCDSPACLREMFASENINPDGSLRKEVAEEYKVAPEIDNETFTQFRCPRCGSFKTWGITRREVAKVLYERLHNGLH